MTGTERVSRALIEIGVLGAGQTAAGSLADLALQHLQRMFDRWAAQRLMIPAFLRTVVPLTSGTRDYTIGSGGDINIVRPESIFRATVILDDTQTDDTERPITVFTDGQWATIPQKTLDAASIEGIYYDHEFSSTERATISTYPTIDHDNASLVLYTPKARTGYSVITDDLEFPPAWDDAIHYELARRLCRPLGRPLTGDLVQDADDALRVVGAANVRLEDRETDTGFEGGGVYNIETDSH